MNKILKLKNFLGRLYRSCWGIYHNKFDKIVEPKQDISFRVIGKTIEQRNIVCYELGNGHKNVLFVGGIHGNEVGTVKLAYRIINWCYWNKKVFENALKFFIIPCLNVDGYEKAKKDPDYMGEGRTGRMNTNDVDLNRNFSTQNFQQHSYWFYGKNYSKRKEVYCGTHGGSEPETQALMDFILSNDIKLIFSLHSYAAEVQGDDNSEWVEGLGKLYAAKAGFKYYIDTSSVTGTLQTWCKENNIYNITIESSNRWGSDWRKQAGSVEAVIKELAERKF